MAVRQKPVRYCSVQCFCPSKAVILALFASVQVYASLYWMLATLAWGEILFWLEHQPHGKLISKHGST